MHNVVGSVSPRGQPTDVSSSAGPRRPRAGTGPSARSSRASPARLAASWWTRQVTLAEAAPGCNSCSAVCEQLQPPGYEGVVGTPCRHHQLLPKTCRRPLWHPPSSTGPHLPRKQLRAPSRLQLVQQRHFRTAPRPPRRTPTPAGAHRSAAGPGSPGPQLGFKQRAATPLRPAGSFVTSLRRRRSRSPQQPAPPGPPGPPLQPPLREVALRLG